MAEGTTVMLDPESSYYRNVNVTVGGRRGEEDGAAMNFDFLATN